MGNASHAERLDLRISPESKRLIARAAELTGVNLTAFATSTLVEKAHAVIDRHAALTLSDRDRDRFLSLLDKASKPNGALRRAARRHRESVR